jgi:hypothetical protein
MIRTDDHADAQRGAEAAQVLGNRAYIEAMQTMREEVYASFKACPIRDTEGLRLLAQLARLTEKFEVLLAGYVESGRLAQSKIDIDGERDESGARRVLRKIL